MTISLGQVECPPVEISAGAIPHYITADEALFRWERVGAFQVRQGREIIVEPYPEVEARLVRLPLLGIVFTTLLYQRGILVLHGSAMLIDGRAVAFLGGKGLGKSTLAAALYKRGHKLIADDVVALNGQGQTAKPPLVLPAFPQFKLWPEATIASLGEDPDALPRLHSGVEKRARQLTSRFAREAVPLAHLYVLSWGSSPEIVALQPQEGMMHLIANSFAARFGGDADQSQQARSFFRQAELARTVPIYHLQRPSDASLPVVVRLVEAHLAEGGDAS